MTYTDENLWDLAQSFGLSEEQILLIRLVRDLRSQQKELPIAREILQECDRKLAPLLRSILGQPPKFSQIHRPNSLPSSP